jgi:2',3'-cyclic-nucleotide 2'-phosphodiesterase (5'-nucleotidase family)
MVNQLKPWSDEANIIGQESIGKTAVYLDSTKCYDQECNIGNLFTDAMVHEVKNILHNNSGLGISFYF